MDRTTRDYYCTKTIEARQQRKQTQNVPASQVLKKNYIASTVSKQSSICKMARSTIKEAYMASLMTFCLLVCWWGSARLSRQTSLLMKLDAAVLEGVPPQQHSLATSSYKNPFQGHYEPALVEAHVVNHTRELQFDVPMPQWVPTCQLWTDSTSSPYYTQLHEFIKELENYYNLIDAFRLSSDMSHDLRQDVRKHSNHDICDKVKLHPKGLPGIFSKSQQLSLTSSGYIEPLLPPMRHPNFCLKGREYLLAQDYLIHDFEALCHKLKPHSRTVFVDMGASLSFHPRQQSPALFLIELFRKFGFQFDHIYAYEMTPYEPHLVFQNLPQHLDSSYHWINLPVSADPKSRQNPWTLLLENFDEDDLVIVKMDIDTAPLEEKLADQLLHNPQLARLVDHFYFEHHVNQKELMNDWGGSVTDSVADSLHLFHKLRQLGVPAHFWV
jgi:hypothetical protein